jgi:hypothetical protein
MVTAAFLLVLAGASDAQPPTPSEPTTPPPGQPGAPPPIQPGQPPPAPTPTRPAVPEGPTGTTPTKPPEVKEEPPPPPRQEPVAAPQRVPEQLLPSRAPTLTPPPTFVGPDLFNPPAPQGWLTVTPTFTLSAEYSDNIFLTSKDRKSDVIVGLTPGVTLGIQRPSFRLLAGYNTRGEIFIDQSDLSNFGNEQNFFTDLYYQVSPTVTFTLNDTFVFSRESNSITSGGVSVGRRDALRNTLTPQLRWQATQSTALSLLASWSIIRFSDTADTPTGDTTQTDGAERDSDTYRVGLGANRRLTARLNGGLLFEVGYFDIKGEPSALTYSPTASVAYDITPTLRGYVGGGPVIVDRDGETSLFPTIQAGLSQAFKFGLVDVGYDRSVVAETIGLSDRQTVFASLVMPNLLRGLRVSLTPRYTIADTDIADSSRETDNGTVKTFSVTLQATYQIARNISLIGSYTYYRETSSERNIGDIDQNRVFLGVQYAFPINFY